MRQLKDINGRLRVCTRCTSGEPAVLRKVVSGFVKSALSEEEHAKPLLQQCQSVISVMHLQCMDYHIVITMYLQLIHYTNLSVE